MKYLFPPFVNTPFISQISECMSSNCVKCLSSATLWGFRSCLDCTQLWHLEPLTMEKIGIKLKLESRDIEPKFRWHNLECQTLASLSFTPPEIMFHRLIAKFWNGKAEQASALIAFTNKLSISRHDKFIRLKHDLKTVPAQKGAAN